MTYLDPDNDYPYQGEMPSADFSELQMWNFTDGKYGLIYHIGTMPGHMRLSHNAFAITCPDGSVLVTKVIGRSEERTFGAPSVQTRTIDPYKSWRISFDGGLRRYRPEDLWKGPGTDGQHIAVRVELEVSATHPVWEPGLRRDDAEGSLFHTAYKMHHEQALATTGVIEIEGARVEFHGIGHRDHSFGPRDMSKALRGHWINATFDSGWAFLGMNGETDPVGAWERTAIFENGQVIDVVMEHTGRLHSPAPEPRQFEMTLRTKEGRSRNIRVLCTQGVNWFSSGPSEWCVGADMSDPQNYQWSMYFAKFECDGEKGLGFVDRGAHAAFLEPA